MRDLRFIEERLVKGDVLEEEGDFLIPQESHFVECHNHLCEVLGSLGEFF